MTAVNGRCNTRRQCCFDSVEAFKEKWQLGSIQRLNAYNFFGGRLRFMNVGAMRLENSGRKN